MNSGTVLRGAMNIVQDKSKRAKKPYKRHCVIDVGNLWMSVVALGAILYIPRYQESRRVSNFPRRQLHALFNPPHPLQLPFRNL
jgi:hypothetical protein